MLLRRRRAESELCRSRYDRGVKKKLTISKRPELQRLIADCRAGKIGTIVAKGVDRLSRDMCQQVALLHIFVAAGVRVEFSAREGYSDTYLTKTLSAIAELEEATLRLVSI
jgi:DNA invertase Pin-like site-specific DNA recombinase